jgi:hypothetical protein
MAKDTRKVDRHSKAYKATGVGGPESPCGVPSTLVVRDAETGCAIALVNEAHWMS